MKYDEEFDVDVIDVDWENCFECEHGPCYFDWSSINPGGSWSNNLNQMNHKWVKYIFIWINGQSSILFVQGVSG